MPELDFDWGMFDERGLDGLDLLLRLAVATLLGGAIGYERERRERAAGFRTHALVCVASALMMIVSTYGFPAEFGEVLDPARIAAQVVSGIGFLGAGVIIFRKNTVRGLTTAASIWSVSGVGLAAGGGLYVAATAGAAFMLLIQAGLRPVERKLFAHHARRHRILLHVAHSAIVFPEIRRLSGLSPGFRLMSLDFDFDNKANCDIVELTIEVKSPDVVLDILHQFRDIEGVDHLEWREGPAEIPRRNRRGVKIQAVDDEEENGI